MDFAGRCPSFEDEDEDVEDEDGDSAEALLVSASKDCTVAVWRITSLLSSGSGT